MFQEATLFKARIKIVKMLMLPLIVGILLVSPRWPKFSLIHETMEVSGHLLVVAGILIRVYTSLYSGGKKNVLLLTEGPYSVVRNPLYVGTFFATLGLGLLTGSIVLAAAITFIFSTIHHFTVLREEAFLTERFGKKFEQYYQTVPRWIPDFRQWYQPDEISVKPSLVFITIRDAFTFIIFLVLLEIICALRTTGTLPATLTLP